MKASTLIGHLVESIAREGDRDVMVTAADQCQFVDNVYVEGSFFVFLRTVSCPQGDAP